MSLCMDSLHPGILLKVQLRHRAEIVHRQFSQLFLEEVMVAVEKLRNKIAITQVELHKVDLYVTVFNAVQVQRWNHDVASSAATAAASTVISFKPAAFVLSSATSDATHVTSVSTKQRYFTPFTSYAAISTTAIQSCNANSIRWFTTSKFDIQFEF